MRIAIIGAGPAGAFVMLFDPSHPREKPCGGGLTARALVLVADAIEIATLPFLSGVNNAEVTAPTASPFKVPTRTTAQPLSDFHRQPFTRSRFHGGTVTSSVLPQYNGPAEPSTP